MQHPIEDDKNQNWIDELEQSINQLGNDYSEPVDPESIPTTLFNLLDCLDVNEEGMEMFEEGYYKIYKECMKDVSSESDFQIEAYAFYYTLLWYVGAQDVEMTKLERALVNKSTRSEGYYISFDCFLNPLTESNILFQICIPDDPNTFPLIFPFDNIYQQ